jgi:hypothetical protein
LFFVVILNSSSSPEQFFVVILNSSLSPDLFFVVILNGVKDPCISSLFLLLPVPESVSSVQIHVKPLVFTQLPRRLKNLDPLRSADHHPIRHPQKEAMLDDPYRRLQALGRLLRR